MKVQIQKTITVILNWIQHFRVNFVKDLLKDSSAAPQNDNRTSSLTFIPNSKFINLKSSVGQSLVELLITMGLAAILLPAIATGMIATRNGRAQQDQRLQAVAYLKQAEEAVRVVRDTSWASLANGTYHPVVLNNSWALVSGADTPATGLTRQIVISDVQRNISGAIVSFGGTVDPSTKQAVVTVFWTTPLSSSVSNTMYLTRFASTSYIQTTQADFNTGVTKTGIAVTNNSGGEITLGAGNGAGDDWCAPGNSVLATFDLVRNGIPFAISATTSASVDNVYITTGNNASGYVSEIATVDHNTPPNITIGNFYNTGKGYGVYTDHAGGYVYVGETTKTVEILDATSMSQVSYFDAGNNTTGNSVYVLGNIGFVTVSGSGGSEKLYTFNINPINNGGSQSALGSIALSAKGNKVLAVKDPTTGTIYAYVAEASTSKQLEIFQVSSDGKTLTSVANALITNTQQGQDLYVNSSGSRVYLVTSPYTTNQNQFFILNSANKSGTLPSPIGSFSTYSATRGAGMNPTGVTLVSGNKAIVVGSQVAGHGQQYQVFNIAKENAITYCGGTSTATVPDGIDLNSLSSIFRTDQTAYSYILRSDNKMQVIQGGNGTAFTFNGIFESSTFTATTDAMFNSFSATTTVPDGTSLQFKVALKHAVSGSCNSVTFGDSDFVGTDGTTNTYFPASGGILPASSSGNYVDPGQCLRYRAYFNTNDITASPIIDDITFNYSP